MPEKHKLLRFNFWGLGTLWQIELKGQNIDDSWPEQIESYANIYSDKFSRFENTSQVGRLNRDKILNNPDPGLLKMLEISSQISKVSNSEYSVFKEKELSNLGYSHKNFFSEGQKSPVELKNLPENLQTRPKTTEEIYSYNPEDKNLKIDSSVGLDLGSIAKGYLIDKLFTFFQNQKLSLILINAGGDIRYSGQSKRDFYLEHPKITGNMIAKINSSNLALASSNNMYRNWTVQNTDKPGSYKKVGHLLQSTNEILSAYVMAGSATAADAGATALMVSQEKFHQAIKKLLKLEYLVIKSNGKIVCTAGFEASLYKL